MLLAPFWDHPALGIYETLTARSAAPRTIPGKFTAAANGDRTHRKDVKYKVDTTCN